MTQVSPLQSGPVSSSSLPSPAGSGTKGDFAGLLDVAGGSEPLGAATPYAADRFGEQGMFGARAVPFTETSAEGHPQSSGSSPLIKEAISAPEVDNWLTEIRLAFAASGSKEQTPQESQIGPKRFSPLENRPAPSADDPISSPLPVRAAQILGDRTEGVSDTSGPAGPDRPVASKQSSPVAVAMHVEYGVANIICRGDVPPAALKARLRMMLSQFHLDLATLHVNGTQQPIGRIRDGYQR